MSINSISQPTLNLTAVRHHGLDAARAIALFIGIFHHGIESFVSYAKWDWITQDVKQSISLDIIFYISHVFRMQAFFLMSGFFAHLLILRLGTWGFIVNRAQRILLPLLLFWPILYFITYYLWVWGIQHITHCSHDAAVSKLPDYMMLSHGLPLMHLWFLYFLVLYCALATFLQTIIRSMNNSGQLRKAFDKFISYSSDRWWGGLLIGAVMVIPMLGMTDGFGVDTSASGLMPRIAPFLLYGLYFFLGWVAHHRICVLDSMKRYRIYNLAATSLLIITLIVLNLMVRDPSSPYALLIQGLINTLYAFASVTAVYAFLGYMMIWFSSPSDKIRYLSDASYWGYLIHLPLVGYFQILVAQYDWHSILKLILIFAPAIFILFVSYKYVVRQTFLGTLLNGIKKSKVSEPNVSREPKRQWM